MINLLLVEDDESLAYIEKTGLEDIIGGYKVTTATNGKEGLKSWEETRPDVIISDIDMPIMNGFEMVERIRETDQDVIIIFTSALTSPNDVKAGYRLGINNYVKKPFVPEELDAHIQALMKMRGGAKTQKETNHYKLGKYTLDADHATLRNDETGISQTMSLDAKPSSADSGIQKMTISPLAHSTSLSTNCASSWLTNLRLHSRRYVALDFNYSLKSDKSIHYRRFHRSPTCRLKFVGLSLKKF